MNFLAHFYLSGEIPELVVGNFLGDSVKGSDLSRFDPAIAEGIRMHRFIDQFTDEHEILNRSRQRLVKRYRHYSRVIIDIFYDHFLANNWSQFSQHTIHDFANSTYSVLDAHVHMMSNHSRKILNHMIAHNWLKTYSTTSGISRVLEGMSDRSVYENNMGDAKEELLNFYGDFNKEFLEFFPIIIEVTAPFRKITN